jgi:hypothetical protein
VTHSRYPGAAAVALLIFAPLTMLSAAPLGDNMVRLAPSQLKLPPNIGPLRYSSQRRFSDRRMGRAYLYNANGISLSIYVYDYGVADLAEGPDSIPVCEQYESTKREIQSGGKYANVVLKREYSRRLSDTADGPRAREAEYEFDRNGIRALSVVWLTAVDGFFLKIRLTLRSEVADELEEARPEIFAAIARAIAVRRRHAPAIAPLSPLSPREPSIEVDSHHDAPAASLWLIYALELAKHARAHP